MHLTSSTFCAFICKLGTGTYNTFNHISQILDRNITQLQCHDGLGEGLPLHTVNVKAPSSYLWVCLFFETTDTFPILSNMPLKPSLDNADFSTNKQTQ